MSDFRAATIIWDRSATLAHRALRGAPPTTVLNRRQEEHLHNVTASHNPLDTLRASEVRYRRLFEEARDGILILDSATRKIIDANPFSRELLGFSHEELIGKALWEIGLFKDEKTSRVAFRQLRRNPVLRYEDLDLQDKQGRRRHVEFVCNLYDEGGRKVIQCNIRDTTARCEDQRFISSCATVSARRALQLHQLVAERTSQLRKTIGELEAFSYSMAHDMRAPLRAMHGFASCLIEEYAPKLDQQALEYLQHIMRSAIRLDLLIRDVLNYTSILHNPLPTGPVDLDSLVRDIVRTYTHARPAPVSIQIKRRLPKVLGNEALLTQCLSNLLDNALKFVARGTIPHAEISASETGPSSIRVSVKDNGIGIAPENHDRIFRLFERINPASDYPGNGIGLTIVRKAVERMKARVGFDSALGKGSTFWIELKKA